MTGTKSDVLSVLDGLMKDAETRVRSGAYSGASMLYNRAWFIMDRHALAKISYRGTSYTIDQISALVSEYLHA